jgi:hypothetical protein
MIAETLEGPLLRWGPPALYQWLFDKWDNPDCLSEESKSAIRMLCGHQDAGDKELLRRLATAFEYEQLVLALRLEDFGSFVNWIISDISPVLSYTDLQYSLSEFRLFLARSFQRSGLYPAQGFVSLLQEGIDAAAKAKERLAEVDPAVNSLSRQRAVESVHDGMDRALICAERLMELILEFLAQLASKAGAAPSADSGDLFCNHLFEKLSGKKSYTFVKGDLKHGDADHVFGRSGQYFKVFG